MAKQINAPLPHGTQLQQQYTIDRVISTGGFSIVYLAYNDQGIPLAIKEYIPSNLKLRQPGQVLLSYTKEEERRFQTGLKSFFKEAEAIARLEDRSIVKINDFFLANNTAYLIMPFEHGRTLQKLIVSNENRMTDAMVQKIFCEILQGICIFHMHDILHLDLKPSNIWIRSDGSSMIIDFGTSRIGQEIKHLSPPMHTPGFAAPEQHKKFYKPELIGPWTDIYNLGATIYSCIEGVPPPLADQRMESDTLPKLEHRWAGQYSLKMLRMVDKMLRLEHDRRPQNPQPILEAMTRYTPISTPDFYSEFCINTFYPVSL